MSNINFFRVMNKFSGVTGELPSPPVLTCALELANFNLDPVTNKNFNNFRSWQKTYFSKIAVASTASGLKIIIFIIYMLVGIQLDPFHPLINN